MYHFSDLGVKLSSSDQAELENYSCCTTTAVHHYCYCCCREGSTIAVIHSRSVFGMVVAAASPSPPPFNTGVPIFQKEEKRPVSGMLARQEGKGTESNSPNLSLGARKTTSQQSLSDFRTRASIVFPVPGTPLKRMPRGALTPCRYASLEHASVTYPGETDRARPRVVKNKRGSRACNQPGTRRPPCAF